MSALIELAVVNTIRMPDMYTGCIKKCPKSKITSKFHILKKLWIVQQPTANIEL